MITSWREYMRHVSLNNFRTLIPNKSFLFHSVLLSYTQLSKWKKSILQKVSWIRPLFYLGTINLHIISSIQSKYPFENISHNYCIWEKNENTDMHIDSYAKKYFLIIIIEIFQLKECMISMNLMHCLNNILFWKWSW